MPGQQSTPLYLTIKNKILDNIQNQVWPSGTKLPSESEFCRMYNISRITIRQALMELKNQGVVTKQHGKGTFVEKSKMTIGLLNLIGYTEQLRLKGAEVSQKILESRLLPADSEIAKTLKVKFNDPVILVHRLRYSNGEPFMLSKTWIPWKLAPYLLEEINAGHVISLFDYLKSKCNLQLLRAHDTLEPVILSNTEKKLLQAGNLSPALRIESITFGSNDHPVEFTHSIIRGDQCKYFIEYVR